MTALEHVPGGDAAARRLDPFWAALWGQGSQAAWISADVARRQIDAGLGRLPKHLHLDVNAAWQRIHSHRRGRYLNVLAALDVWRTATGEQIAAITGEQDVASGASQLMADLFAVGLVDVGVLANPLSPGVNADRATVYRPSRTTVFDRQLAQHLTYAEWVSVTGGYPYASGSQFDRHNILTTEFGIRAAEMAEVAAVIGEKLSSWDLLAHTGAGFDAPIGKPRHADATIVRPDGLRVAVEMTASTGASFQAKVRRWAQLLANRRLADSGLMVLFVLAERPDNGVRPAEMAVQVRKAVAAAARDFPGVDFDRTAERIAVAHWADYFPAPGEVTGAFFTLDAERPTGPPGQPWEPASLLDVIDVPFEAAETFDATAVIDGVAGLRSQPRQLRTGQPPALWPMPVSRVGFDRVPVPAPSRPETYRGKPLGVGFGVSGDAKPPKRLIFGAA